MCRADSVSKSVPPWTPPAECPAPGPLCARWDPRARARVLRLPSAPIPGADHSVELLRRRNKCSASRREKVPNYFQDLTGKCRSNCRSVTTATAETLSLRLPSGLISVESCSATRKWRPATQPPTLDAHCSPGPRSGASNRAPGRPLAARHPTLDTLWPARALDIRHPSLACPSLICNNSRGRKALFRMVSEPNAGSLLPTFPCRIPGEGGEFNR